MAKKVEPPPQPILEVYTLKVESMVPVIATYKITAESPQQALDLFYQSPFSHQPTQQNTLFQKMKILSSKVYKYGYNLMLASR